MSYFISKSLRYLSIALLGLGLGPLSTLQAATVEAPATQPVSNIGSIGVYKPSDYTPQPIRIPDAPNIESKAHILVDAASGKVLAEANANERMAPASLTKMMTAYILFDALKTGQIKLEDEVPISTKAWRTGGSRMFVKEGTKVAVKDLLQGIVVQSGNDACVAIAEYLAGSEEAFSSLMNQQAAALGMKNSHFTDSTGLPHPDHYSTASDLAILARALIVNFPEYYHYFSQKWFTYNNIKQKNRNRLLWRDPRVDGLKTGYTESAGYCLAASAKEKQMRLISLVMGAKSPQARTQQTEVLLDYGFRYYDGYTIYKAGQTLISPRIWGGTHKTTAFGVAQDVFVTIPKNAYKDLSANVELNPQLAPPIVKGKAYGTVTVTLNGETLARQPLIALQDNPRGSFWRRISDSVSQTFSDDEDETKPTAATS